MSLRVLELIGVPGSGTLCGSKSGEAFMSLEAKPGKKFSVTITKTPTRASAVATLERLAMRDDKIAGPIEERSSNFKSKPKRRGGRIWTKWPNKVHPVLKTGVSFSVPATAQYAKDLNSVETFVSVAVA